MSSKCRDEQPAAAGAAPAAMVAAAADGATWQVAAASTAEQAARKLSADNYYGQRDDRKLPHGMGVRLTPAGQVIGEQCGRWEHGEFQQRVWVWRGFLPADAPLAELARDADALFFDGATYIGATSGPLHVPHGAGKTFWPDGKLQSQGTFVDGMLHGAGSFHSQDGSLYTGNFVHGKVHGGGRIALADGSVYEGQWQHGELHGIGRYTFVDGNAYEGHFAKNNRHGLGVQWNKDGFMQHCGSWHDDKFVKSQPVPRSMLPADSKHLSEAMQKAGADILLLTDGGYYSGGLNAAHQRHGEGAVHWRDGSVLQRGVWWEDELICELPKVTAGGPGSAAAAAAAAAPGGSSSSTAAAAGGAAGASASAAAAAAAPAPPAARVFDAPSSDCVICLDRPRDCLIDCPHFCLCFDCAQSQQQCPICRAKITQPMRKRVIVS